MRLMIQRRFGLISTRVRSLEIALSTTMIDEDRSAAFNEVPRAIFATGDFNGQTRETSSGKDGNHYRVECPICRFLHVNPVRRNGHLFVRPIEITALQHSCTRVSIIE